jgi:TolB-like protein
MTTTMSFFEELKRRNVVKMAALYAVASWLILQVADVLFDALELPSTWARLILAILILGFPLTVIFAWVYEMTPEGLKREKDVDRSQSVTDETGRKINILIIVLLVLAIAVVALDRWVPQPATVANQPAIDQTVDGVTVSAPNAVDNQAPDRSVAVLPFANRSAREEDSFFVDGIHDDILTQLARIGSLTVISRTSVEKFRGTTQSMKEIGNILGVKNILEGGVQRAGDRVRINVQLIKVSTDAHLWAETYDRELTAANIFSIQSEISTAIAEALKTTLSPEETQQLNTASTENMAALEAYFLGRQSMAKRTRASLADAEQQFKAAIELDPDYALAYVGLANIYVLQTGYSDRLYRDAISLTEPLIEKALSLNEGLGEAYIAKAWMANNDDRTTKEALYKKGIVLAPGYADGHLRYGNFLSSQSRAEEALVQLGEAARLDPLSGVVKVSLGNKLEDLGRFDEARAQYESVIRIDPDFPLAYSNLGGLDWRVNGRLDNAIVRLRQAANLDPGSPGYFADLARLWANLGGTAEAERSLDLARSNWSDEDADFWAMGVSMRSGEFAEAHEAAEAVLAQNPANGVALLILGLNDLHADRVDLAIARYRAAHPALLDDDNPDIDILNFWQANDIVYLLQKTGDYATANMLLDRNVAFIQTIPRLGINGYWIEDARIHMLQGRTERALAATREAVDSGWRSSWRYSLKHDPVLEPLHGEPEYQAIIAEVEADMAAQLARVRQMEANGELVPIPE